MDICNWNHAAEWTTGAAAIFAIISAIAGTARWLMKGLRKSHDDLSQQLTNTNQRIDDTNQRIDDTNRRFEESMKENRMIWIETNKRIDQTYQLILEELKRRNST